MKAIISVALFWVFMAILVLFNDVPQRDIASVKTKETRQMIMVIDTGIQVTRQIKPYLCSTGHKSFIFGHHPLEDYHGHGTNVAGLIAKGMDPKKQCLVIVKYWDKDIKSNVVDLIKAALRYAIKLKPAYVNMSLGGPQASHWELEYLQILIKNGTKIAVAAGNDGKNLDQGCYYFPACYNLPVNNFRVVGSNTSKLYRPDEVIKDARGRIIRFPIKMINGNYYQVHKYSNFGSRVTHWENGTDKGYKSMHGSSQATAISMSRWIQGK